MNSEIVELLKDIQGRLDSIEKRLGVVQEGCTKIEDHVNFVERTYTLVRRPLNFIIQRISGTSKLPPLIENKITLTDKE